MAKFLLDRMGCGLQNPNLQPLPWRAQVRQPETVEVANFLLDRMGRGAVSAELLQPDELVAAIIAQVAAEPAMGGLLSGFIYAANGAPALWF